MAAGRAAREALATAPIFVPAAVFPFVSSFAQRAQVGGTSCSLSWWRDGSVPSTTPTRPFRGRACTWSVFAPRGTVSLDAIVLAQGTCSVSLFPLPPLSPTFPRVPTLPYWPFLCITLDILLRYSAPTLSLFPLPHSLSSSTILPPFVVVDTMDSGASKTVDFLGPPPQTGSLSPAGQKLMFLATTSLAAIVTWGSAANYAAARKQCQSACKASITFGAIVWVLSLLPLLGNFGLGRGTLTRTGAFTHGRESLLVAAVLLFWVPTVGMIASPQTPGRALTQWAAWIGLFAAVGALVKAAHTRKEEDQPSPVPVDFDEEDLVYG